MLLGYNHLFPRAKLVLDMNYQHFLGNDDSLILVEKIKLRRLG